VNKDKAEQNTEAGIDNNNRRSGSCAVTKSEKLQGTSTESEAQIQKAWCELKNAMDRATERTIVKKIANVSNT